MKPWHDTPIHDCNDGSKGPVVEHPSGFICGACGQSVTLTEAEAERCRAADRAWDAETQREVEADKRQREHERKLPLLKEALERRRAMRK